MLIIAKEEVDDFFCSDGCCKVDKDGRFFKSGTSVTLGDASGGTEIGRVFASFSSRGEEWRIFLPLTGVRGCGLKIVFLGMDVSGSSGTSSFLRRSFLFGVGGEVSGLPWDRWQ